MLKRKFWNQDEVDLLLKGVEECGVGNWALIKQIYFSDSTRTHIDIRYKYRNMMVKSSESVAADVIIENVQERVRL